MTDSELESHVSPVSSSQPPPAARDEVVRSPADVLRLVVSGIVLGILLLVEWLFGDAVVGFVSDLLAGIEALPDWLLDTFVVGVRLLTAVVLVGGFVWTAIRGGWRVVLTALLAAAGAALLAWLLGDWITVDERAPLTDLSVDLGPITTRGFPTGTGIAVFAALLTACAPWLARRWRRWGWIGLLGLVLARFLTAPVSFDTVRAAVIGWLAGSAALVVLGAPTRRPSREAIAAGLAAVDLPLRSLQPASVDARGSTPYFGVGSDGEPLFVKALGVDERSADLLFRLYRWARRKDLGDERPFSSLRRAVEHEALVAMVARDASIRTPRLRAFATAEPASYVLAYEAVAGRSVDRLDPDELTDDLLAAVWQQVARLHRRRIAHRDLRLANIFVDADGEVWIIDFGFSELAASDLLLATDVAELAASSSVYVGAERAAVQAIAQTDPASLAAAADRLHLWALGGATRTALKERPGLLEDLRARLAPAGT